MSKEEMVEAVEKEEQDENVKGTEYTPAEEKAMSSGWRPEDEWTGETDDWIDAGVRCFQIEFDSAEHVAMICYSCGAHTPFKCGIYVVIRFNSTIEQRIHCVCMQMDETAGIFHSYTSCLNRIVCSVKSNLVEDNVVNMPLYTIYCISVRNQVMKHKFKKFEEEKVC